MSDTDELAGRQGLGARGRGLRRVALALLVLTGVINYLDRSTLSIANSTIQGEMGLSKGEMGILLSAFSWTYAFAQLPTGLLVDRIGPRRLLAAGLALWSLAQAGGGLARGFGSLVATRAVLGVGEAPQFPTGARVVSNWYPVRERGLPTGLFNASSSLGPALAPPILTALMEGFGWRWMFFVMGAAGLAAAVAWYLVYRDPDDSGLSEDELKGLRGGPRAADVSFAQWLGLFRHVTTWGMTLGFAGALYLIWLYLTWLPGFLKDEHHMSNMKVGVAASVPFVFGFFGSLAGGWLSDRLSKRGLSPVLSRKLPIIAGLFGMAVFTIPAALTRDANLAVFWIALAVFCGNVSTANAWALVTATAPPNCVASLGSIQNFGGYFGGSFAPVVTGFVVERSGSFAPALILGAGVAFASALVYLFLVREPIDPASTSS